MEQLILYKIIQVVWQRGFIVKLELSNWEFTDIAFWPKATIQVNYFTLKKLHPMCLGKSDKFMFRNTMYLMRTKTWNWKKNHGASSSKYLLNQTFLQEHNQNEKNKITFCFHPILRIGVRLKVNVWLNLKEHVALDRSSWSLKSICNSLL